MSGVLRVNLSGLRGLGLLSVLWLSAACVTINVYFPAAAAEKAADRIIDQVWGPKTNGEEDKGDANGKPAPAEDSGQPEKSQQSAPDQQSALPAAYLWLGGLLEALVPPAQANADFDVSTPAIQALQARMTARHAQLQPHYASGAVGLTHDGLIKVRDAQAIPLPARAKITKAVAEENQDRLALYQEIAKANNHPEWETQIQATFAKRWIGKAKAGWWYQDAQGGWQRK